LLSIKTFKGNVKHILFQHESHTIMTTRYTF